MFWVATGSGDTEPVRPRSELRVFRIQNFKGETAIADHNKFLKDLAIAGGLLALVQASLLLEYGQ